MDFCGIFIGQCVDFCTCAIGLVSCDGIIQSVVSRNIDGAAQCLCILTVGRLCFEPLVEHSKVTVNVCNQCIAVIQNSGLHTVLPLHGQSEAFREKAYRNISAALLLVRCGINSGGLDNLAGAVIGYG